MLQTTKIAAPRKHYIYITGLYILFALSAMVSAVFSAGAQTAVKSLSGSAPGFRKPVKPVYSLEKIEALIAQIPKKEEAYSNRPVPAATYDSFSLREKFTYTMIHPEAFLQNCAYYGDLFSPGRISKMLTMGFNENTFSRRQREFLQASRDSVLFLVKETFKANGNKMGLNLKKAIIEVNGWEIIPLLVDYYNIERVDSDVLTTLIVLMKNGKYDPFINSTMFDELYGKGRHAFYATVDKTPSNESFVLKKSIDYFYQQRKANPRAGVIYH